MLECARNQIIVVRVLAEGVFCSHVNREFAANIGRGVYRLRSTSFAMPGRGKRVNSTAKTIFRYFEKDGHKSKYSGWPSKTADATGFCLYTNPPFYTLTKACCHLLEQPSHLPEIYLGFCMHLCVLSVYAYLRDYITSGICLVKAMPYICMGNLFWLTYDTYDAQMLHTAEVGRAMQTQQYFIKLEWPCEEGTS